MKSKPKMKAEHQRIGMASQKNDQNPRHGQKVVAATKTEVRTTAKDPNLQDKIRRESKFKGEGHPVLFSFKPAVEFDPFPDFGGYPKRFLGWARRIVRAHRSYALLHVCSGSVRRGVTVDIRRSVNPTVQGDGLRLPFRSALFDAALIDPPYTEQYAKDLYRTKYPPPSALVREAIRCVQPGGRVGILHFQVPYAREGYKLIGVWGVTTGSGYAIRAFSVFEKDSISLF